MKILADATIPGLAEAFPKPFELTFYTQSDEIPNLLKNQQILLCRSTLKVNAALLTGHSLQYVATASSGTDHINKTYLHTHGIELIDAKGSNAPAVADYVIATLAFLQKYKAFHGTKAGIIGAGEVGSRVAKRLTAAGLKVICYDPPREKLDVAFHSSSLEALADCELICVHANLHQTSPYPSMNLLNKTLFRQLKPGCVIINASRGGIVNEEDLLNQRNRLMYCTDVFVNEPLINPKIVDFATICTPHIAGHSIEAKYAAVIMVSEKLHARYQLLPPAAIFSPIEQQPILPASESETWQDRILSLYNPYGETEILKSAENLESTFLSLRKAHQNRHDFSVYDAQFLDSQTRRILTL